MCVYVGGRDRKKERLSYYDVLEIESVGSGIK